jgi:8-oxo-dGTP pyrophosphatase MutT (NUDIX family)
MIDGLFRILYRCAYRVMRVYWATLHPRTHGALVCIWHRGQLLLVHNSYVPYYSLPGGYVRRRETGVQAACRELQEEVGLRVEPGALAQVLDLAHVWEGKRERLEVFALRPAERPHVRVDNREVVEARFVSPEEALALDLFPPIRTAIEKELLIPRPVQLP